MSKAITALMAAGLVQVTLSFVTAYFMEGGYLGEQNYGAEDMAAMTELEKVKMCPECGSPKVDCNGSSTSSFGVKIQRYICQKCGRRFSDTDDLKKAKEARASYLENIAPVNLAGLSLNAKNTDTGTVQISAKTVKNLGNETQYENSVSQKQNQSHPQTQQPNKGIDIIVKDFQYQLKIENKSAPVIRTYGYSLLQLAKLGVDLFNPQSFLEVMTSDGLKTMTPIRKHGLTKAYKCFLSHNGIKADIPKVKIKRKIPYIPPKDHQDKLFGSLSKQMATFCFTLQATAARPIEGLRIEWDDIDKAHSRININHPAKGGNCRSIKVSPQLIDLILSLPHLNGKKVFTYETTENAGVIYRRMRRRAAQKFNEPELLKIHFYSERYWRATKERHAKGNPDAVQYLLGHSSLAYVQIYAQLAAQCFGDQEFDIIEVRTPEELRDVGKKGYEKYDELNGVKYYRKPKTD